MYLRPAAPAKKKPAASADRGPDEGTRGPRKTYDEKRRALPLRLTETQWDRVKDLARHRRTSVQELAILGLSMVFESEGLPKL